uniref:Rieske domain-containing protein n=1 Tax=Branchiostoma floridae TaxID=7739 RepID=C3ZDW1_BRAFL|eukprot:XP_002592906.1 hypothetical protein BRAFLDRAFT_65491 [Branchiostoma floridae]
MEQKSVEVLRLTPRETAALKPGVNLICKEAGNFVIYKTAAMARDCPSLNSGKSQISLAARSALALLYMMGSFSVVFLDLSTDPRNPEEPYKACRNICKHQGGKFVQDVEDSASSVLRCTKHGWRLDCSTMKYVNPPDSFSQERLVPELEEDGSLALVELIPPEPWKVDARAPQDIQPGEVQINADLRFMILMDGVHPDMDTCILVDYKGHLILNTVDCTQPNGMRLPRNVDIMMSDFAGGASGFPMAFFGGRYTSK